MKKEEDRLLTVHPTTEKNYHNENWRTEGLLLRDHFAAKAMQGDWAAQSEIGEFDSAVSEEVLYERAKVYYRMADAMIAARGE